MVSSNFTASVLALPTFDSNNENTNTVLSEATPLSSVLPPYAVRAVHPPTRLFHLLCDPLFSDAKWEADGIHFGLNDFADRPPRTNPAEKKDAWNRRMMWWKEMCTSEKNLRTYGFRKD